MAKLYFRYGAMGSSKTANAIMVQYNYEERGQRVLMLKPRLDNRDGALTIRSRCGLETTCRYIEDITEADAECYDCVIVDEAQFLTKAQVALLVRIVDDCNVPVIAYGLRADFRNNLFEGSQWLLAWADTIEEIKTICWCGRKALCNARRQRACREGRRTGAARRQRPVRQPLPEAFQPEHAVGGEKIIRATSHDSSYHLICAIWPKKFFKILFHLREKRVY